jgi:hypothetical protein
MQLGSFNLPQTNQPCMNARLIGEHFEIMLIGGYGEPLNLPKRVTPFSLYRESPQLWLRLLTESHLDR